MPCVYPDEELWEATNVDLAALQLIVSSHFHAECPPGILMNDGDGVYARAFLFSLDNKKVVARVVLPVRESVKTEAEVATMELIRARTKIPVPQVYLYCNTAHNPVGAEWILMEYMPGTRLGDSVATLTDDQKVRTGMDMADIMYSLFQITARQCGSLLRSDSQDDRGLQYRALRYPINGLSVSPGHLGSNAAIDPKAGFAIGPVNDIGFLPHPTHLPAQLCGPFSTEREWMEGFALMGKPPTRAEKTDLMTYSKILEIYDIVARYYENSCHSTPNEKETFHLAHGDFSERNILIDPETGAITGVLDWEMAGFRPAWLAAVAGGWFDDDSERFIMSEMESERGDYRNDTPGDAITRARFRLRLAALDKSLFRHYQQGVELRALLYACRTDRYMDAYVWLGSYHMTEWPEQQRGPLPYDFAEWLGEMQEWWQESGMVPKPEQDEGMND
ncbi:kinase-like domain-containing protein [Gautieria morchelliformis]|nr:kinase-like domain-containing protein [Gautieria morchelliformis]